MSKILIVEDDAGFASSLAEAVRDFGYEVTIAPSGEDALARFDEIGAALVFLDLRLRGMHGLEVLRDLKSHPDRAATPVVILTAFADAANTIEGMKLGAFDHLTKPIGRDGHSCILARLQKRSISPPATDLSVRAPQCAKCKNSSVSPRRVTRLCWCSARQAPERS